MISTITVKKFISRNKGFQRVMMHGTYLPASIDLSHWNLVSALTSELYLHLLCNSWQGSAVHKVSAIQVFNEIIRTNMKEKVTRPVWQLYVVRKTVLDLRKKV